MTTPLDREVARRVARHGPLHLDEVLDVALYDPEHGFYGSGVGAAGRRGDFLTSPEVGPLFGTVVARALDDWWVELGRPDPFTVIEAAAGVGTLARAVLQADPACAQALTYVLVERSAALRRRQAEQLPLSDAALAFPPIDPEQPGPRVGAFGRGPRVVSLPDFPAIGVVGVVLANELLDNLAFRLLERGSDGWLEVRVGVADPTGAPGAADLVNADDPELVEVLVPADEPDAALAERLAPGTGPGARVPIQRLAAAWLTAALDRLDRGRLVVFDYASDTPGLAARPWTDWVRTYRDHAPGGPPLGELGSQDVTCEVDEHQLSRVRRPDAVRDQSEFLRAHGLDELVDEGRRIWRERVHIGDLAALRARSRVGEAEALTDIAGLGAFRVFEWGV
jgi:SAM-dependent MidA family methyltransferase